MAWIESHTVLLRHPKLINLAHAARIKPVYAMGHLHALWHAAIELREDGDLSSWSDDYIAQACAYTGDAPQWVRLLQEHGWLNGRILHDWLDYAGRYLESRYRRSNPHRLSEIWSKHGRTRTPALAPSSTEPPLTEDSRAKAGLKPGYRTDHTKPYLTLPNRPIRPGSEKASKKCGWKDIQGGVGCQQEAEFKALFCRDHILKARESKESANSKRGPGW